MPDQGPDGAKCTTVDIEALSKHLAYELMCRPFEIDIFLPAIRTKGTFKGSLTISALRHTLAPLKTGATSPPRMDDGFSDYIQRGVFTRPRPLAEIHKTVFCLIHCAKFVPHQLLFIGVYWRLRAPCKWTNTVSD